jgi:hypothetical protein
MSIDELLPAGLSPSTEHSDMLLELAYLVAAVDGRLAEEELAAFGVIAARLRGRATSIEDLDVMLERFGGAVEPSEIHARMKEVAAALPKDLHAVAYRLAIGLAVVDHEPSEEEDRLHKALGDALGLSDDMRAALSRQVGLDGSRVRMPSTPLA